MVRVLPLHTDIQQCAGGGKMNVYLWGHGMVPLVNPITELFGCAECQRLRQCVYSNQQSLNWWSFKQTNNWDSVNDETWSTVNSSNCLSLGTAVTQTAIVLTVLPSKYVTFTAPIFSICTYCIQHLYIYLYFSQCLCCCILYSSLWMLILALSNEPLLWIVSLHYK